MEATNDCTDQDQQISTDRLIVIMTGFFIIFFVALYVSYFFSVIKSPSRSAGTIVISQGTLEQKYGLRVNLVAVTAAGGFVDVRLKIVDGQKSKLLLADKQNFPTLSSEQGVILNAPEETKSQEIQYISGGNLFIVFPNSGNAVLPSTQVTIQFGDIAVEPIPAR